MLGDCFGKECLRSWRYGTLGGGYLSAVRDPQMSFAPPSGQLADIVEVFAWCSAAQFFSDRPSGRLSCGEPWTLDGGSCALECDLSSCKSFGVFGRRAERRPKIFKNSTVTSHRTESRKTKRKGHF